MGLLIIIYIHQAVEKAIMASNINDKSGAYQQYLSAVTGKSNSEAREIAKDVMGESVFWDWDRECSSSELCNYIFNVTSSSSYTRRLLPLYGRGGGEASFPQRVGLTQSCPLTGGRQTFHGLRTLCGSHLARNEDTRPRTGSFVRAKDQREIPGKVVCV